MTNINDIADLARVLEEHPEWLNTIRGILLTEDLATVPAELRRLSQQMAQARLDLTTVGSRVSNLTGDDYEGQAAHFGRRRLRDILGVTDVQLMYRPRKHGQETLQGMLHRAALASQVTLAQRDDLEDADLIFQVYGSERPGLVTAHVVAEASITVQRDDVIRARRRTGILEGCTTLPAQAAVIGASISPEARQELANDVIAVSMAPDGRAADMADGLSEQGEAD